MDTLPRQGKEESVRFFITILAVSLIALTTAGCVEAPGPTPPAEEVRAKPSAPPNARKAARQSNAPTTTRGSAGQSPSTGEPVEVHNSTER